ncbi:hypothetical protein GCM10027447_38750 [Glycomyces halotolerans]
MRERAEDPDQCPEQALSETERSEPANRNTPLTAPVIAAASPHPDPYIATAEVFGSSNRPDAGCLRR